MGHFSCNRVQGKSCSKQLLRVSGNKPSTVDPLNPELLVSGHQLCGQELRGSLGKAAFKVISRSPRSRNDAFGRSSRVHMSGLSAPCSSSHAGSSALRAGERFGLLTFGIWGSRDSGRHPQGRGIQDHTHAWAE